MPVSFSQDTRVDCPECRVTFSANAWTIVDAQERPDLAERCRDGSIFAVACPNGHAATLPSPLLYNDSEKQLVVFAIPLGTEEPQAREIHGQLMSRLTAELSGELPEYLQQTRVVLQQFLTMALADDPEAAYAAYRMAQREAAHLTPEEHALAETLEQFIQATTWGESRRILDAHPELGTDDADQVLAKLIDAAGQAKDENAEGMMRNHRELLQNVRRHGVETAFAQVKFSAGNGAPSLPPEIAARLAELNVQTEQDFERALQEHPDLAEAIREATMANDPGAVALQELSSARSPQDVLRTAAQFPILLEDGMLGQFQELILNARQHGAEETAGHWNRCLQTIMEFRQSGMSLEQWEEAQQQLQNPQAAQVFKELEEMGVRSPEALEKALQERPDLLERWNQATRQPASGSQEDDAESPAPELPSDEPG